MQCSNLWCGLPNCISGSGGSGAATRARREIGSWTKGRECNTNEVCVPALKETCLSPPCVNRGDCRVLEQSLRTAPPKYPTSNKCWPNQAFLSENCSRINIILDILNISKGLSTESYCHNLRTLLGGRMLEQKLFSHSAIILICDIKSGTNDTIEVTVVSLYFLFLFKADLRLFLSFTYHSDFTTCQMADTKKCEGKKIPHS